MKSRIGLLVVAGLVAGLACDVFAQDKPFSIGAKVWNSVPDYPADTAWMYGGVLSYDFSDQVWVSAQYLYGKRDYDVGVDENEHDAEGVVGTSFKFVDVGVGARYVKFKTDNWDVNSYGPMGYLGFGTPFGDLPIGWYATGAWMFYDFGDDEGDDKWEHFNLEGGLSYANDYIIATLGYRYKDYYNQDSDWKEKGFTGSVSVRF